jgi:hypothetical protein
MTYDPVLKMTVVVSRGTMGWNGSKWVQVSSTAPGSAGEYLAFDQGRNQLVALDSNSNEPGAVTSVLDGTSWKQVNSSSGPRGHFGSGFAYDPRNGTIVLFGGSCSGAFCYFDDTWLWNGTAWTQVHPATSPPKGLAAMAYDMISKQMILLASDGTWNWDGTNWSKVDRTQLLGGYTGLVYDTARQNLFMWGGNGGYESGSHTWTYSNGQWTRRSVSLPPAPVPSPAPTPTPTPVVATPFSCRLPVWGSASNMQSNQDVGYAGGFVNFPGGRFTIASETLSRPPQREGVSEWTYRLGRWLPTRREAVAPDGSRYAWIEYGTVGAKEQKVHVVDAATGQDIVVAANTDLDRPTWLPDGIYLVHHLIRTDSSSGLVRIDPATGARTEVPVPKLRFSMGWEVRGGAAWTTDLGPQEPLPDSRSGQNRLQRYDLRTGQLTLWLDRPGQTLRLMGFDGEKPVVTVRVGQGPETVTELSAPNASTRLFETDGLLWSGMAFADAHGLWFIGPRGILLMLSGKPQMVSAFTAAQAAAGPCE